MLLPGRRLQLDKCPLTVRPQLRLALLRSQNDRNFNPAPPSGLGFS